MVSITKFMVIVDTKNFPIITINPCIQRYAHIRKKMTVSEIAACIAAKAIVHLEKNDGVKVRLTADNFKTVLRTYQDTLTNIAVSVAMRTDEPTNAEAFETFKDSQQDTVPPLGVLMSKNNADIVLNTDNVSITSDNDEPEVTAEDIVEANDIDISDDDEVITEEDDEEAEFLKALAEEEAANKKKEKATTMPKGYEIVDDNDVVDGDDTEE